MPLREAVLGRARVSLVAGTELVESVVAHAVDGGGGYVCIANAHQLVEAWRSDAFAAVNHGALYVSTDSRVIELALQALGHEFRTRVLYGSDLLEEFARAAAARGINVGLLGSTPPVLDTLAARLRSSHPALRLTFVEAPGFGSAEELATADLAGRISEADVDLLLVGLGCPKQERWMSLMSGQLRCTSVGLGAAFEFVAGHRSVSPAWVRRAGLDWFWRLAAEPRRLWRRYLIGNIVFLSYYLPLLARKLLEAR